MATHQPTKYREIAGYPGYRVGDDGSVWSRRIGPSWKQLKVSPQGGGYLHLTLYNALGPRTVLVHRLVLEAFVGPCPDGCQCLHDNNDPTNCRLDNLRWGTPLENAADSGRHGTRAKGERQGLAVLTADRVREIRRLYRDGIGPRALAVRFEVHRDTIRQVVRGFTWRHVD